MEPSRREAASRQWHVELRYMKQRIVERGESLRRQLASVGFAVKVEANYKKARTCRFGH